MLSILSTMSEDNLMHALSAVGIEGGGGDDSFAWMEEGQGLESWNAKDVRLPPPNKPALIDPSKFVDMPQQVSPPREMYVDMGEDMGGLDDYEATVGHQPLMAGGG
jgi:hypothetical protein